MVIGIYRAFQLFFSPPFTEQQRAGHTARATRRSTGIPGPEPV